MRRAEGVLERNQGQRPGGKRESSAEILGRYSLLAEIAAGDLTTVHLARQHGDSGFQRLVALRRLKPLFARQPEYVQLLLDEARLTSGLHHANVLGCLDMGTEGGCYIVQNYVEGDSLDGLLARAGSERHARYTVPLIVDLLNGLHSVHTALDDDGVPLSLVHQAPRPRHVLVGIDGTARLTDFTQAKARGIAPTRQRADRLKVADMAPEQALNPEAVDHRADLFVVGVTLWEALTGERLFAAEGEENTFQHLLHRRIPRPSEVGFHPPRCFDAICLRALERDPEKRYRSSLEMARELRDIALNHALYATAGEIGQWVKALAGPKLIELRKLAGSESSSQEVNIDALPSATGGSGFYQSTKPTDPYGSGLIFGGSFSRLEQANPMDHDKTPALGVRANIPASELDPKSAARRERDDEPTARHNTLRDRKSTEPMWGARDADKRAPQEAAPTPASGKPRAPVRPAQGTSTQTLNELMPASVRPNAPRAEGEPSPGAYSQSSARKSRPGAPELGHTKAAAFDAGRAPGGHSTPTTPTGTASKRTLLGQPGLPGANPAANAVARPQPRTKAAVDGPSLADHRNDSTPTRWLVGSGPVGSPYRNASPSKTPKEFEPRPPPRALGELTGRTQRADVLQMPVDSLTPPTTAQRTQPPTRADEPSPRSSRAIWFVTALLATIILLAAGVSVRNWQNTQAERRVTASQPKVLAPALQPAKPSAAAPMREAPASEVPVAAEPAADQPEIEIVAKKKPRIVPSDLGLEPKPSSVAPDESAKASAKLQRAVKTRARPPLPIPDNPY